MERIRALTKRKDVDYLEVRVERGTESAISLQGKDVETVKQGNFLGGNVRVLVDGVWGFVYFTNLDELPEKIDYAIEQAKSMAKFVKNKTGLAYVPPTEVKIKANVVKNPFDIPLEDKVKMFTRYADLALSSDKRIINVRVQYKDKFKTLYFANSEGTYVEQEILDIGGYIVPNASDGKITESTIVPFGSSETFEVAENLEEEILEKSKLAVSLLGAEQPEGGEYPVIIDQDLGGVFIHEAFGHLSEADFIFENEKLKEIMRIGNKIGSDILNVVDTGNIRGKRGALLYDDEGVKTVSVDLIKNGILSGHLHTRETAFKMKEKPTGNARAINFKFAPIPRMRTTYIKGGNGTFDSFVKDIKKGIYAKGSFGGQTNGELFTFVSEEAYLIENGKITKLLRDVSLSGNVFKTLKNIVGVANDFSIRDSGGGCGKSGQWPLPVSHGAPHIYISKVIVGGKR